MKKSLLIIVLSGLLILTSFMFYKTNERYHHLKAESERIFMEHFKVQDEMREIYNKMSYEKDDFHLRYLKLEEDMMNSNKSFEEDLTHYEYYINLLTTGYDDLSYENRENAYVLTTLVVADDVQFEIPENGEIAVDSSTFELIIHMYHPPEFRDKEINERIHVYENILKGLKYPEPDEKVVTTKQFHIKYNNLKKGDNIQIELPYGLMRLLNLDTRILDINVTDEFMKGSEFMPRNLQRKVFTGGYENGGFSHHFTYLKNNRCILDVEDTGASISFMYDFKDGINIIEKTSESSDEFYKYERIVLPEKIRLGESFNIPYSNTSISVITGVNLDFETKFGTFKAVEVTTYYDNFENSSSKVYYTKEHGMVYADYSGFIDELVEVEYLD